MNKLISKLLIALSVFAPNYSSAMEELGLKILSDKQLLKEKTSRFEGFGWEKVINDRNKIDPRKKRRIGTLQEVEDLLRSWTETYIKELIDEGRELNETNKGKKDKEKNLSKYQLLSPEDTILNYASLGKDGDQINYPIYGPNLPGTQTFHQLINTLLLRKDNSVVCRHLTARLYKTFYDKGLISAVGYCGYPSYDHAVFIAPYKETDTGEIRQWVADPMRISDVVKYLINASLKQNSEKNAFDVEKAQHSKMETVEDLLNFSQNRVLLEKLLTKINEVHKIPEKSALKSLDDLLHMPLFEYIKWDRNRNMLIYGLDPANENFSIDFQEKYGAVKNASDTSPRNGYMFAPFTKKIDTIRKLDGKTNYHTRSYSVENKIKK